QALAEYLLLVPVHGHCQGHESQRASTPHKDEQPHAASSASIPPRASLRAAMPPCRRNLQKMKANRTANAMHARSNEAIAHWPRTTLSHSARPPVSGLSTGSTA